MYGSLVLYLLSCSAGWTDAARTPRQKAEQRNSNVILPPRLEQDVGDADLPRALGEKVFSLRHIYHRGAQRYPDLHRYVDVPSEAKLWVTDDSGNKELAPTTLRAKAATRRIQRLSDRKKETLDHILEYAQVYGESASLPSSAWTTDEVAGPNVTDKETVVSFAKMANNAYTEGITQPDWMEVGGGFNYTEDFGWENDGLRGHIFADNKNETVVIGLKGTSMAVFDGAGTTGHDKLNDNLFASCCCAQGGQYLWKPVCDCMTDTYTCNSTCLVKSLKQKSHYYTAVRDLYHNVTERYPHADIWLTGHSLGGVVSSLLGLTYGLPTLTFEAYPDALAASRLGLPIPPGYKIGAHHTRPETGIYHFGHTADPIFMGTCNAASSLCTIGGYAFQSQCHTSMVCTYDTVEDFGWRVGLGTHRITSVIRDVLEKYDTVPKCEQDIECQDCFNWKFFESNSSETTTTRSATSTKTSTRTRTETCKTPGWWGCLDESTTTSGSTTSTSSSSSSESSTTTCHTPGWFGCKDEITTTITSSSSSSTSAGTRAPAPSASTTPAPTASATSTSICKTPGWLGCNDPTTTPSSSSATPSSTLKHTTASQTSTTCTSADWFGFVCVDPSSTESKAKPSKTSTPKKKRRCRERDWWGWCKMDAERNDL
ncbi:hypothetical protein B0A48_12851 [Cryoendolithus antarcticus]|uniref:triacylglycerol lipase n=1 Tax=Cryoendolithus antarcticus TaxID=1507870 RepID=A0A1V8SQI8_9PEZI|nr:hypothetical protein B0A48_12851 [Cryoendolithus antarcticus]